MADVADTKPEITGSKPPASRLTQAEREEVALMHVAGLSQRKIAANMGIVKGVVQYALADAETQQFITETRSAIKRRFVERAASAQERYWDGVDEMPVDRKHATAHRAIIEALAKMYDKTAHAAGEATERIETKNLTITIDQRRELVRTLRESKKQRQQREDYAAEHSAG